MKQFEKIKVGEDIYTIIWRNIGDDNGEADCNEKKIVLNPSLSSCGITCRIETLLHEIAHTVACHFGLDDFYQGAKKIGKDLERFEKIIDSAARGTLMVMMDNPDLFRWILDQTSTQTAKEEVVCSTKRRKTKASKSLRRREPSKHPRHRPHKPRNTHNRP
jgi:hypothetical protein